MAAHCDFLAGVTAGKRLFEIEIECYENNVFLIFFISLGACNMFISHPLDTVKTNMQSGNMRFVQAAKTLFKTEGVSEIDLIFDCQ